MNGRCGVSGWAAQRGHLAAVCCDGFDELSSGDDDAGHESAAVRTFLSDRVQSSALNNGDHACRFTLIACRTLPKCAAAAAVFQLRPWDDDDVEAFVARYTADVAQQQHLQQHGGAVAGAGAAAAGSPRSFQLPAGGALEHFRTAAEALLWSAPDLRADVCLRARAAGGGTCAGAAADVFGDAPVALAGAASAAAATAARHDAAFGAVGLRPHFRS